MLFGVLNSRGYGVALALGASTPVGAAAVAGAVAVPTFYAVALGAAVGVVVNALRRARSQPDVVPVPVPGLAPLVLLVVVGTLVTLIAPILFDGLRVLLPTGGEARLEAGVLTKSNIAQLAYLVLSVSIVVFLARARWAGPQIVGIAAGATTLLSFWAWSNTFGVPFPVGFFDNSPFFVYQGQFPGGRPRVRGILSEPASLATSSLVTIAYATSLLSTARGLRRWFTLALAVIAVVLGSVSTSATFFVAGAILAVLALAVAAGRFLLHGSALGRGAVAIVCALAVAAVWVLPLVAAFLGGVVSEKVGESSYDDRSGADDYSLGLVLNTFGIGVGLGSNRASSFVASLLSTVGVVGAALFLAAIWTLVRDTWKVAEVRPVTWALMALLVCKVISGPDLADPSGILWLSLGVLAHTAVAQRSSSPVVLVDVSGRRP